MRLSTDADRDDERAVVTITAAAEAGITVFDTAGSYGVGTEDFHHNERLLARAVRQGEAGDRARIVTKGGMRREGGHWIADGRARTIVADCEASLSALDGLAIDTYLVHAPDPRTPWRTTIRALTRVLDAGLARRVGVANVNRTQLEQALAEVDIGSVQVGLSLHDDSALRGGLVELCEQRGIPLMAHSPLGGTRRAGGLARRQALVDVAAGHGAAPAEVALAWLLAVSPAVVPIPGARRPETARSAARARDLHLTEGEVADLARAFGAAIGPARGVRGERSIERGPATAAEHGTARADPVAEVVLVMGIPGAGKSRLAAGLIRDGYARLNRDERGGTLAAIAAELDSRLAAGNRRMVLDNTYLTRASRSRVIEAASRQGVPTRCLWLDTPLEAAQVNLVERMLDRVGSRPSPEELRSLFRREPGFMGPTSQMRAVRELEPPSADEGFAAIERISFQRAPSDRSGQPGVLVAAGALERPGWVDALRGAVPGAPHLLFDWLPDGSVDDLAAAAARLAGAITGAVDTAICLHGGGPPTCWCRPPLPGLPLAFARAHQLDLARSTLVGVSAAHRTLARALGCGVVLVAAAVT
ncbi:MAG: hypothetical protein QOE92_538 [Chloroflexota bacterium]|nr:hypothetical protein [Chloroflexota bacterium]